jgi:protocatechuate 3,4-dioxygenase beta subunit
MLHESNGMKRRQFIKGAATALVALPAWSFAAFNLGGCSPQTAVVAQTRSLPHSAGRGSMPCSSCIAPANILSRITISSKDEPGAPLEMSGTIYQPDGITPAEGIVLFVYHTDSTGYYNKDDNPYNPKLRGWMKTGKEGRYEFRTIKPAPYPKRSTPAHIHAQIYSSQIPEYGIDDYWFDGDPFITPETKAKLLTGRGGFPSIIELSRNHEGILSGVRDIKLESPSKQIRL